MFTLVICIFIWLLIGLVINKDNTLYSFDKKATLPLRGILALLIVLHHFQTLYSVDYTLLSDLSFIGAPICSVFFFLSGYGLMKSWLINPISSLINFPSKRIIKLAPPIFIVIFLNIFIQVIKEYISVNGTINIFKYNSFILMPHFWFVFVLIGCYFAFYCSARFFKKGIQILVSVGILIFFYCILMSNIDSIGTFWWVSTPGFFVGMCVAIFENRIITLHSTSSHLFSLLIVFISTAYYVTGYYYNILPIWGLQFICILPIMVFVCTIQQPIHSNGILNYLGKLSYEIYLVHVLVMQTIYPLLENNLIFLIITFIITILLSKAIYKISNYFYA